MEEALADVLPEWGFVSCVQQGSNRCAVRSLHQEATYVASLTTLVASLKSARRLVDQIDVYMVIDWP